MMLSNILFIFLFGMLIVGCGPEQPKPLYNYGSYSNTYYAYKKNPTEQSLTALQQSLEDVIAKADQSQTGRVPPGIYANLGYLYLKAGKSNEAIENFKKEKTIYPESAYFMDKLIKRVQDAQESKK